MGVLREAFRGRLETGGVAATAFFRRAEFCGRVLSPVFLELLFSELPGLKSLSKLAECVCSDEPLSLRES